jgi:hypothetical protein
MIEIRRDTDIPDEHGEWFRARWHFSFDQYRDPESDGFGAMRVFNDYWLIPGAVWPLHPHRDAEGITYVVEGLFGHEDNVGGPHRATPRRFDPADDLGVGIEFEPVGVWKSYLQGQKIDLHCDNAMTPGNEPEWLAW